MSKKALFSKEDWQLIADGPEYVLAALAAADGDVSIPVKMKETAAYMKAVGGYSAKSVLVKEVIDDKLKPAAVVEGASLLKCVDQLEKINDLLVEKVTTVEGDAYRDFLNDVGQAVAKAAKESLLGSKMVLSPKEMDALKKIRTALKSSKSKVDPKPVPAKKPATQHSRKPAGGAVPQRKKAAVPAAPKKEYIAEHTVEAGETLSHISLKYYGSAVKAKYMLIYEENKAVIGDNPNLIKPGQVFKIPKLEG